MMEQNNVADLLARLQEHVPFLKEMIVNLKTDMPQHGKIVALHNMITDKKRKFKFDTLKKCEEVILKMKAKTNYKAFPRSPKDNDNYTIDSPDPEITDNIEKQFNAVDRYVQDRPSVYTSAAESIAKPATAKNVFERLGAIIPEPDTSKPPISVADLELLKSDEIDEPVVVKPVVEEKYFKKESKISLVPAPIIKPRPKPEKTEMKESQSPKVEKKSNVTSPDKWDKDKEKSKVEKIVKDAADSIFGNLLSSIDEKILVQKRRDSKEGGVDKRKDSKEMGDKRKDSKEGLKQLKDGILNDKHKENQEHKNTKQLITTDEKANKPPDEKPPEKVYKRLADKYNPKPRKPTTNVERTIKPEDLVIPLNLFPNPKESISPIKKPEETKIPFILSPERNLFENTPKVDPRLQSKNPSLKTNSDGFLSKNEYAPHVWESPIHFPSQSPSYNIPPSPVYSNPIATTPTDNRNIFSVNQQFQNRPNNPNIRAPKMSFQQNNFQRIPNHRMNIRGPRPNMHQNQNFQHPNFNQFGMPHQNRFQDPRIINQPPARHFSPFEPLNSENESKNDYYAPPGSQTPNPYSGGNHFQPFSRFQPRNQYNQFNRDTDTPTTYKSWREERESRDPRLSRREEFQRGRMRDSTEEEKSLCDNQANNAWNSPPISRGDREKSVPREIRGKSVTRDECDRSTFRQERAKSVAREESFSREERGRSVARGERGRSVAREERGKSVSREIRGKSVTREERGKSVSREERAKSVSREVRGKSVSREIRGKSVSREERGKSVSREERGKSVSREERGKSVPREVRGKSVSREERGKSVSRERGKSVSREERGRSTSRETSNRSRSSSRETRDRSRERAKSVSKYTEKSSERRSSKDSKSRKDDYKRRRSPDSRRSRGDSRKSRYDQMYSSLNVEDDNFQSPLDNLYTRKKKDVLQTFKIPKKPKAEETVASNEEEDEDEEEDKKSETEMKVTSSDDPPVVSSDQVSSTEVEESKNEPEGQKNEKVENIEANLKTITGNPTEQLAELNSGLPPNVKEEFRKWITNIKEHVGTPIPLLDMFGMLVDYIKPTTEPATKPKEDTPPEVPSSSGEVDSSVNKTEGEESDDDSDLPLAIKINKNKQKNKKLKKVTTKTASKKKDELDETDEDDKLVESVGERIKNRKRHQPIVPQIKKPRKNELDKLHEDIKETMGEGVLAVPMKRACTVHKELEDEKVTVDDSILEKVKDVKVVLQKLPDRKAKRKIETEVNTSPLPKRKSMTRAAKAIANYADEEDEEVTIKSSSENEEIDVELLPCAQVVPELPPVPEVEEEVVEPKILRKRTRSTPALPKPEAKKKKMEEKEKVEEEEQKMEKVEEATFIEEEKEESGKEEENREEICYVEPDKSYYLMKDNSTEYKCKVCDFSGSAIVDHYMLQHPKMGCLVSRLSPEETEQAIKESELEKLDDADIADTKTKHFFKCRFCLQEFHEVQSLYFYNHLTSHTCEFRYKCGSCHFKSNLRKNLRIHYSEMHGIDATYTQLTPDFSPSSVNVVCGYVCSECNFLQLNKLTVDEHIQIYHLDDTACVKKINMSLKQDKKPKKTKKPPVTKAPVENKLATTSIEIEMEVPKTPAELEVLKPPIKKVLPKTAVEKELPKTPVLEPTEEPKKGKPPIGPKVTNTKKALAETKKQKATKTTIEGESVSNPKELDISVFMCGTDIEDETSVKVSRLEKMKEINESVTPRRTSIVNKLKDRFDLDNSKKVEAASTEIKESPAVEIKEEKVDPPAEQEKQSFDSSTPTTESIDRKPVISTISSDIKSINDKIKNITESIEANISTLIPTVVTEPPPPLNKPFEKFQDMKIRLRDDLLKPHVKLQETLNKQAKAENIKRIDDGLLQIVEFTESLNTPTVANKTTDSTANQPGKRSVMPRLSKVVAAIPLADENIDKVYSAVGVNVVISIDKQQKYVCKKRSCIFSTGIRKVFENHCSLKHKNETLRLSCSSCDDKSILSRAEIFNHVCRHVDQQFLEENVVPITAPPTESIVISDDEESPKFTFKITQVTSLAPKKPTPSPEKPLLMLNGLPPLAPLTDNGLGQIKITDIVSLNKTPASVEQEQPKLVMIQSLAASSGTKPAPILTIPANEPKILTCRVVPLTEEEISQSRKACQVLNKWMPSEDWATLFKCPCYTCIFTTNAEDAFSQHIATHKFDSLVPCLYCNYKMKIEYYAIHLVVRHKNSKHGCPHCLYRAVSPEYVKYHLQEEHVGADQKVLYFKEEISYGRYRCPALKSMKEYMKPYLCRCNKKYFAKENFTKHLKNCAENKARFIFWNIFEYNCRYCSFSEPTTNNFLKHMAKHHPFHPICIIMRHLKDPNAVQDEEDETIFDKLREITTLSGDNSESDIIEVPASTTAQNEEVNLPSETSSTKDDFDESTELSPEDVDDAPVKTKGLTGMDLFKCAICKDGFPDSITFKSHLSSCMNGEFKNVKPTCFHCDKMFKGPSNLIEHIRIHGTYRIGCSLCPYKNTHQWHLRAHMKMKHKIIHCKFVPTDPKKTNIDSDEFMVRPYFHRRLSTVETQASKEQTVQATSDPPILYSFGPDNIHKLPIKSIFNYNVSCSICNFQTKVRMNLLRHMSQHENGKEIAIPITAPVNPVPCLEKNELMFDKMTNLASSSHAGGRMGPKLVNEEPTNYPIFIPLNKRYVCGAKYCNYLCLGESMLRHHLQALHAHESTYTCAHCKVDLVLGNSNVNVDSVLNHLRLHDNSLYKCFFCNYLNNNKVKVEKHCMDKHPDKILRVVGIRENIQQEAEGESKDGKELREGKKKPWKCAMCKGRFYTKDDAMAHAESKHAIDSQYKCSYCDFKTFDKDSFSGHFETTHNGIDVDYIVVYYSDEQENAKVEESREAFDTTPLWMKNKTNQIKHIRGILLEEQPKQAKKSPIKQGFVPATTAEKIDKKIPVLERKLSVTEKKTPAEKKAPAEKKTSAEKKASTEKSLPVYDENNFTNLDLAIEAVANGTSTVELNSLGPGKKKSKGKQSSTSIVAHDDTDWNNKDPPVSALRNIPIKKIKTMNFIGQFGPIGKPFKSKYLCPICKSFKTKEIDAFRTHLCQELKYYKFGCQFCEHKDVTLTGVQEHILQEHILQEQLDLPKRSKMDFFKCLTSNILIEDWLYKVRTLQDRLINDYLEKEKSSRESSSGSSETEIVISGTNTATSNDAVDPLESATPEVPEDEEPEDPSKLLMEIARVSADCEENRESKYISSNKALTSYSSSVCDYTSPKMQKHSKTHVDASSNRSKAGKSMCYYCSLDSVHRQYLIQHHRWRHRNKELAIIRRDNIENLVKMPQFIERLKCGLCEATFKEPSPLKEHFNAHHAYEDFVYVEFGNSNGKIMETARKSTATSETTIKSNSNTSHYGKKPDITDEECKRITTTLEIMNNFVTMNVAQLSKLLNIFPKVEIIDSAKKDTAN